MANFYGSARTNYVHFNLDKMEIIAKICELFSIRIIQGNDCTVAFTPVNTENGLFVDYVCIYDFDHAKKFFELGLLNDILTVECFDEDTYKEIEFDSVSFSWQNISKYMNDGEILIVQSIGSEKLRYFDIRICPEPPLAENSFKV
jgi:hypothetical protein